MKRLQRSVVKTSRRWVSERAVARRIRLWATPRRLPLSGFESVELFLHERVVWAGLEGAGFKLNGLIDVPVGKVGFGGGIEIGGIIGGERDGAVGEVECLLEVHPGACAEPGKIVGRFGVAVVPIGAILELSVGALEE